MNEPIVLVLRSNGHTFASLNHPKILKTLSSEIGYPPSLESIAEWLQEAVKRGHTFRVRTEAETFLYPEPSPETRPPVSKIDNEIEGRISKILKKAHI